ncbi:MAG: peptidylprolyl isomerase, partial [Sedimentisphaerales bacterium]|nr:peptidylprolyl isomerase [Sedimentisphaerales bacterium]
PDPPAPNPPAAESAGNEKPDKIVVSVNGENVTEMQVEQMFQRVMQQNGGSVPPDQVEMLRMIYRTQIIEAMIDKLLVQQELKKINLPVSDSDLDRHVDKIIQEMIKQYNLTMDEFKEQLKLRTGQTIEQFATNLKADPLFRENVELEKILQQRYGDEIVVTDDEVKKFYDENLESRYQQEDMVRASHILIKMSEDQPDEEKKAALEQARKVLDLARKEDADFAALALQYSSCPSKERGGDLDFFPRHNAMVEPFAEAAFKLQPGQICDEPVLTMFGYHIIKVTDRKPARTIPFDEVRDDIREQLILNKKRMVHDKFVADIKTSAKIVYPDQKDAN